MTSKYTIVLLWVLFAAVAVQGRDLRLGMVGLDTGHVIAFTKLLHDRTMTDHVAGARVVGAVKTGSPDIASSWSTVDKYIEQLRTEFGVTIYDSIEELVKHVDAVLIESVDGRPHLARARVVIAAGKSLYIEKPLPAIPPVTAWETLEILAFMEADYLSKERGGAPVSIEEIKTRAGWRTP